MKTIKLIGTSLYELTLMESESGQYVIYSESNGVKAVSGPFSDYKTAAFVYEELLQGLQGN